MIRAGREAADDARAAQLLNKALGTYRNTKTHQRLTDALVSRPGARARIYDEELLTLLVPPLLERRRPTAAEAEAVAHARRTVSEAADHDQDLLDAEEAWHAMPPDDRPTLHPPTSLRASATRRSACRTEMPSSPARSFW
ncbi:hypothetical protein [Streptomyces sp. UH6]|uniref:hypothetical protein n=1 Tax=Streptomyces sp. UH6 TaxID=2748379 RepID=UPI0015D4C944|nr:hypothetical protein [Streptomyces sp. UH6]NYV73011.1 hypothetical protein [Streptomyces sp. UH6]